jgi:hypothetical protein
LIGLEMSTGDAPTLSLPMRPVKNLFLNSKQRQTALRASLNRQFL